MSVIEMPYPPMTQKQEAQFDKAVETIRDELGSFIAISRAIEKQTGIYVSYMTVRKWFDRREVPPAYAFVFYDLLLGDVDPFTLVPWLKPYFDSYVKDISST